MWWIRLSLAFTRVPSHFETGQSCCQVAVASQPLATAEDLRHLQPQALLAFVFCGLALLPRVNWEGPVNKSMAHSRY